MNSSDSSSEEDNLTSSMLSIQNDLNNNVLDCNEDTLLNNYKYSKNYEENLNITIKNFMDIANKNPYIFKFINEVKTDILLLPEFIKYLKLCDYKLTLNIMDNPKYCFENIFENLNSDKMEDHIYSVQVIQKIFPNYNIEEIFEFYKSNNYSIEDTINYLII